MSSLEPLSWPAKDKDAQLVYALDWDDWLETGDSIISAVWVVSGGITKVTDGIVGTQTRITIGGGTVGTLGVAHVRVTSALGQTDDRTASVEILEK